VRFTVVADVVHPADAVAGVAVDVVGVTVDVVDVVGVAVQAA